jgi:hypothetical protein
MNPDVDAVTAAATKSLYDLNVYGPADEVNLLPGFFRWRLGGQTTANVYPASY